MGKLVAHITHVALDTLSRTREWSGKAGTVRWRRIGAGRRRPDPGKIGASTAIPGMSAPKTHEEGRGQLRGAFGLIQLVRDRAERR